MRKAEATSNHRPAISRVGDLDWERWTPTDRATLLFVVRNGEILLMRKKRGLGAGKINAPGGRIEPGEATAAAAVREVQEELCVTPFGLQQHAELSFQFVDGYSIHVHVFSARGCRGTARETDEAVPLWTSVDDIPYKEMWPDDALWLPLLLRGERFRGWFIYEDDGLLDDHIQVLPAPPGGAVQQTGEEQQPR